MAGAISLRVDVDVRGLEPLFERLQVAPRVAELEMQAALIKSALAVTSEVKDRTPVVTGWLRASIDFARISTTEVRVRTNVHYAPYVEAGRGPIRARPGHALGEWPGGMRGIGFRKSVKSAPGRHMFREGLRASAFQIRDAFRDAVRYITGFIAGK